MLGSKARGTVASSYKHSFTQRALQLDGLLHDLKSKTRQALDQAYELKLERELPSWTKPKHVGIIMDGNRRFAKEIGAANVVEGHHRGADKLDEVLSWCELAEVKVVSVWGMSLDNFNRSADEVSGLMSLFERKFLELVTDPRIHRDRIRVRSMGRVELLPPAVQKAILEAERATQHYDRRVLNVCVAYGGREEILDAFRSYLASAEKQGWTLAQARERLQAELLAKHMYGSELPDPDLIIRTSGEIRLSGFMLWASAYAEYYFCDVHWPQFRKIDFLRALRAFHQRQRRFGR